MAPEGAIALILKGSDRSSGFSDEFHCVAKGLDGFGCVIGDLDAELFFEGHNQLNGVEAVCAQIVDEGRGFDNLTFFNAKMLDNDLFHAISNVAHILSSQFSGVRPAFSILARPGRAQPDISCHAAA